MLLKRSHFSLYVLQYVMWLRINLKNLDRRKGKRIYVYSVEKYESENKLKTYIILPLKRKLITGH